MPIAQLLLIHLSLGSRSILFVHISSRQDAVAHAAGLSGSQSSSDSFSEAIDGFVAFRNTIRCLSLATGDQQLEGLMKLLRDHYGDSKTDKQILKEYRKITAPYMTACDGVRLSSKQKGVDISVSKLL